MHVIIFNTKLRNAYGSDQRDFRKIFTLPTTSDFLALSSIDSTLKPSLARSCARWRAS
jgi:hypothetical protein